MGSPLGLSQPRGLVSGTSRPPPVAFAKWLRRRTEVVTEIRGQADGDFQTPALPELAAHHLNGFTLQQETDGQPELACWQKQG